MQNFLIAIHLIVVVCMIGTILIQRSEGGGLGLGGSENFMKGRAKSNFLTRTTTYLAIAFFLTTISITIISRDVASISGEQELSLPGFEDDDLALPDLPETDGDSEAIPLPDLDETSAEEAPAAEGVETPAN